MAGTSETRSRPWAAFLAGAVVMLLLVLAWSAWRRMDEGVAVLRDLKLPRLQDLPVPASPPPEGPRLPPGPAPAPR